MRQSCGGRNSRARLAFLLHAASSNDAISRRSFCMKYTLTAIAAAAALAIFALSPGTADAGWRHGGWGGGWGQGFGVYLGPRPYYRDYSYRYRYRPPYYDNYANGYCSMVAASLPLLRLKSRGAFPSGVSSGREGRLKSRRNTPWRLRRGLGKAGSRHYEIRAGALFVCRPFVYFTPAQKGGCLNANSSNFDCYCRRYCCGSGPKPGLQIRRDFDQLCARQVGSADCRNATSACNTSACDTGARGTGARGTGTGAVRTAPLSREWRVRAGSAAQIRRGQ